jgi:hypothetical protein
MTTREERRMHVDQMNANFAIEDFKPDRHDKALQQRYIDGDITLEEMRAKAIEFAKNAGSTNQ